MSSRKFIYITGLLIVFLLGALTFRAYDTFFSNSKQVTGNGWGKLMLILNQVDKHYVDTLAHKDIVEAVIPSLLKELDPHSVYLPPELLKNADEQLMGNFDGIGIQFNVPSDTAVVINVIPGGPSERAGLMSGDRIVEVDGTVVAGVKMPQDSLIGKLRGESGSVVNVMVKRMGVKDLVSFDITRDKIPVKSVDVAYMINDTTGYIKLSKFTKTSYQEFMEGIESLKKNDIRSLLFDLRDNAGGYFDQALLLSNEFLDKGEPIVYMEGRRRPRQDFYADGKGALKDIDLRVLVDEGSASSSEIFAGAIQDNDRGVIVGRRSFGKGLVQEPIYFSDNSGIRLTVARFYTPTGRSIQKPYGNNDYMNDIYERYLHGEMTNADSIEVNDSLKYTTPGGKTVYGGGGITPDIFVPVDTTFYSGLLVNAVNRGLTFRFSARMADKYRKQLNGISKLGELDVLFAENDFEGMFRNYLNSSGVEVNEEEWRKSGKILMTQVKAFVGRYSPLDDMAFYPVLNTIDDGVKIATEL
jgi:carboxyl-terminal processing protease